MKIADLIDAYEGAAKLRGLAPTQLNALKPVRRGLGPVAAGKLNPLDIIAYTDCRRRGHFSNVHGNRPAADGTIRRELGALSAVLNWAHQRKILRDAPPKIDLPPPSPPRKVFLKQEDADRMFDYGAQRAMLGSHVGLWACLALDTWARTDAIETLTWDRVGPLRIDYRDPTKPETHKRRVPVPISARLARVLSDAPRLPAKGALVVGPVTQYTWQKFRANALPHRQDVTRHDLRRTGISLALARGVEPLKVAQMAGDDLETIMKHYAHFMPDYLDGVVT